MADDKKLENELLSDEKLDNVAGGAIEIVRQSGYVKKIERTPRNEYKPLGDNRDINPACMSAAFINGDITGGEDF